jgi:hypothetical protein
MTGAPAWTEERTAALGVLIDAKASSAKVAKVMCMSRGAVCGRANRLGWQFGVPRTEAQRLPPFEIMRRPRAARSPCDPADAPITVYCRFDRETYAAISRRAEAEGSSRQSIVRDLVEWGLEAVRHEAAA